MLRRCTACLALTTAALTMVSARPTTAAAAGTTNYVYYELVNTRPTTMNDLVVTNVVPPNSIAPPDPSTSPLTILDSSFGFDRKNLQVFLSPADPTSQGLAIKFANGGLAPGGTLDFKLSLDPSVGASTVPQLQLQSPDTDLKLVTIPPPSPPVVVAPPTVPVTTPTAPSSSPVAPVVPEPVALALWSAMAGVGLLRARAFRRSRRAVAASA